MTQNQTNLLPINAFGIIRLTKGRIMVNVTAVRTDGKAINRLFTQEIAGGIDEIEENESPYAAFGAKLDQNNKWLVIFNEVLPLKNFVSIGDLKEVSAALNQAFELLLIAA